MGNRAVNFNKVRRRMRELIEFISLIKGAHPASASQKVKMTIDDSNHGLIASIVLLWNIPLIKLCAVVEVSAVRRRWVSGAVCY